MALTTAQMLKLSTASRRGDKKALDDLLQELISAGAGTPYGGALVRLSSNQSIANAGGGEVLNFDLEEEDTDSIHDNSTNNSRLNVPVEWTKVQLAANVRFAINAAGNRNAQTRKNGAIFHGMGTVQVKSDASDVIFSLKSADIDVVGGTDYFELLVFQNSGVALDVVGDEFTWFSMKRVI